jgi:transposase-like protein
LLNSSKEAFFLTFSFLKIITKLVYLVYKDISKKWQKSISNWAEIISQFAIIFDERLEKYL